MEFTPRPADAAFFISDLKFGVTAASRNETALVANVILPAVAAHL
jgi:hypothetical protein